MKLLHLSDLHLGKRVNEYNMLEDQKHILNQILDIADRELPQAVLLAGDIYDKAVPSAEAVQLFDDFLSALAQRELPVFLISGNHDSPERIAFGSRLMAASRVFASPVFQGSLNPICLEDEWGSVEFYLLPFLKPAMVRRFFPEREIASYTDALAAVLESIPRGGSRRVLITHQFVTGAARSESEELSVGGTDNVDASVFEGFDYVALGHIHSPQNCGSPRIRYCGTPLKYSFSEAGDEKSVTIVELKEKGSLDIRTIPLVPLRDLVELKGSYNRLTSRSFYADTSWQEDYTHITLTDEEDIPDAAAKLRTIYHNLMKLSYDNTRTRSGSHIQADEEAAQKSPLELFGDFYAAQNNQPMNDGQAALMQNLIEKIWEVNT